MDAFFAAIEERDKPRLKGLPIVVGADPKNGQGRGVVSTANYKARKYGIHSAMPISQAWRLSEEAKRNGKPKVTFMGGNFSRYHEVSENVVAIIKKYAAVVERASIDEVYLDLSFTGNFQKAKNLCEKIKNEIKKKEQLTCSIGIGPNKLIAKIAADFKKPDGLTIVGSDDEKTCAELTEAFLEPLPIRKIPGIGPKTEETFKKLGIKNVGDLKKFSHEELKKMMGKWGIELYEKIRGRDNTPVTEEYEVKSIGEQETFPKDTKDLNFLSERLGDFSQSVFRRFKASDFKTYKTLVLTVRFDDFETKSRSHTLNEPAADLKTIRFEALRLLLPFLDKRDNPKQKLIRLLGVRIEKLL